MLIGEVARRSGVSARMLRHYESLGLISPSDRTVSGYREYSAEDIGRIFHIEGLRKLGMSLAEAGTVLDDPQFDAGRLIRDLVAQSKERIAAERALLRRLEQIDELGGIDGESLLLTIDLLRSLESGDVIQRHKAALGSGVDGSVPVESLSAAVLSETVLNAAGAMRWALAQSGSDAVRHLAKGMDSTAVDVRRNAVRALDEIRRNTPSDELDDASRATIMTALRSGLGDTDLEVRTTSALILAQLRDPSAVPDLLDMAMDGPKDIEAAEALAAYVILGADATGQGQDLGEQDQGSSGQIPEQIMAELRRHAASPDAVERFRVLQVLMEIPGDEVDDFIAELAADGSREVAATATAALQRRRGDRRAPDFDG
ncbi:MAG: MerR family transcriptional regulator [Brevibacterium sp.]